MTDTEARAFLSRVFGALFDPTVSGEEMGAFFAADYQQIVDGKQLDRDAFIDHAKILKSALTSGAVTLEQVIASGTMVASKHVVRARKASGEEVQVKVLAFFEIEHGLIRRTEELTHVMAGSADDRDLGSRTSG